MNFDNLTPGTVVEYAIKEIKGYALINAVRPDAVIKLYEVTYENGERACMSPEFITKVVEDKEVQLRFSGIIGFNKKPIGFENLPLGTVVEFKEKYNPKSIGLVLSWSKLFSDRTSYFLLLADGNYHSIYSNEITSVIDDPQVVGSFKAIAKMCVPLKNNVKQSGFLKTESEVKTELQEDWVKIKSYNGTSDTVFDSILTEANSIVNGDRNVQYGDVKTQFQIYADIFKVNTGKEITPQEVCQVLIAVKLGRERFKHKRDNLVDLAGYTEILNRLNE